MEVLSYILEITEKQRNNFLYIIQKQLNSLNYKNKLALLNKMIFPTWVFLVILFGISTLTILKEPLYICILASVLAGYATHKLIPSFKSQLVKAHLFGNDLHKADKRILYVFFFFFFFFFFYYIMYCYYIDISNEKHYIDVLIKEIK